VPKLRKVNSLKYSGDFLMHGVVLQNRVFRTQAGDVSRETSGRPAQCDVSRETVFFGDRDWEVGHAPSVVTRGGARAVASA